MIFHCYGMLKATKKSISLLQSNCPLIKTIDCIIQSFGGCGGGWFLLYAPQLLRTVCFQGLILTSWFNYYQAHIKLISTANVSVIDFDTDCLDLSFLGSYPVKVSSLRDFEVLSRDMIRILSHTEICSFAALKCLQSGNMYSRVFYGILIYMSMTFMDSMSMITLQTLGLQQMSCKAAIESAPKALLSEAMRKLSFTPCTSKFLLTVRLAPFTRKLGLSSTISCLRAHY